MDFQIEFDLKFPNWVITMDKIWVYYYDPETR